MIACLRAPAKEDRVEDEPDGIWKIEALLELSELKLRAMAARDAPPHGVEAPKDVQIKRAIVEAAADVLGAIKLSVVEVFREADETSKET
jgi:hypothetical protein